jgi:hypothetical protein
VGALKISNLTQLERFEEDLAISRVQLHPPAKSAPIPQPQPKIQPEQLEQMRQRSLQLIQKLKKSIH